MFQPCPFSLGNRWAYWYPPKMSTRFNSPSCARHGTHANSAKNNGRDLLICVLLDFVFDVDPESFFSPKPSTGPAAVGPDGWPEFGHNAPHRSVGQCSGSQLVLVGRSRAKSLK